MTSRKQTLLNCAVAIVGSIALALIIAIVLGLYVDPISFEKVLGWIRG